jgi:hypothetical protein
MVQVALNKVWLRPSLIIFSTTEPSEQKWNISSMISTDSGTKVQYTTSATHDFQVGDSVQVLGSSTASFNFSSPKIIRNVTSNTFKVDSTATGTSSTTATAYGTKWDFGAGPTLYLTDDNRSPLQMAPERIESKKRMIDGTMRSVFVADKYTFSTSWENISSRKLNGLDEITSDGFGAGIDIKDWYESNYDDFWLVLVYDNDDSGDAGYGGNVEKYNVFFDSFDFTITKRGQYNDLWDVSIGLVEV